MSNCWVRLILIWGSSFLGFGILVQTIKLTLINLNLMNRQSKEAMTKDSLQQLCYLLFQLIQRKMEMAQFYFDLFYSISFILLNKTVAIYFILLLAQFQSKHAPTIFSIYSLQLFSFFFITYYWMQYNMPLKQTNLSVPYNNIMRKDLQRSRAAESSIRRSSVHFHYQSEEEASSQIQNARAFNYSQSHITSDSDDTIKTTNLYSNRFNQSSLSGFAVPAFNLPKDSKKKSDQTEKAQQQQFYTFLQTFGRESELTSSQNSNEFEENQTVCHRSSTAQKRDSSSNILQKEDKNQLKVVQQKDQRLRPREEKFGINQSDQQEESDQYEEDYQSEQSKRHHRMFQKNIKPKMIEFCVQTEFSPQKQPILSYYERRPYKKHEKRDITEKKHYEGCYKSLVFVEFNQREEISERKYPQRVTRDCRPLQFWKGERIDYRRGGYWRQKSD